MERSYGEQSYNPGTLNIMYLGEGPNRYWSLINGNRIRQNILLACYNDSLTEEEVALQIGVSLPYIESDIKTLTEVRLLKKEGKRYRTDIIILTGELESEKASRLLPVQNETAKKLRDFIDANEDAIRSVGFYKNDMSLASLKWHMVTMMLYNAYSAVGDKFISNEDCPVTAFGEHARIWGVESIRDGFNCCIINANEWKTGISLFFMDWSARPELQHNDFYGNVMQVSVFDKIAHGNTGGMTELEQELAAEMIRKGYVINGSGALRSAMPVYTKEQLAVMQELQRPVVEEIVALFNRLYREIAAVLENHVPPQLKAQVNAIAAMSLFNDGTYIPAAILNKNGYLSTDWTPNELATSYAVLE